MALGNQDYGVVQDVLLEKENKGLHLGAALLSRGMRHWGAQQPPCHSDQLTQMGTLGPSGPGRGRVNSPGYHWLKPLSMADKADKSHIKPAKPEAI